MSETLNCQQCGEEYIYDSHRKFKTDFCSMVCKNLSLIGNRFERLVVIGLADKRQGTTPLYVCRCDCGNTHYATRSNLLTRKIRSCGCYKADYLSKNNTKIIVPGTRFGRLTVLEQHGSDKKGRAIYLCQCECGNTTVVSGKELRNRHRTGCSSRCPYRVGNLKHGLTTTSWGRRYLDRIRRESEIKWTLEMDLALKTAFPACVVCGSTKILCVDHVIPLSDGGILEPGNVTILCRVCNLIKSNKSLWEFEESFSYPIRKSAIYFAERYF